jgi:hypothetical protein
MTLRLQVQSVMSAEYFPHKGDSWGYIELSGNWTKSIYVGITLRVSNVGLPPLAQLGIHEDHHNPRWTNTSIAMEER